MPKVKNALKTKEITKSSIKIISFNIRWKGCEKNEPKEICWESRKRNVASIIRFHKADILGLQEPTKDQLDELMTLVPEYSYCSKGLKDKKNIGSVNPILYNKDRFELLKDNVFYLSETPHIPSIGWDAKFLRAVTWAKFKDYKTNEIFFVFNTHFDYHSKSARNKSAFLLKEKIKEITKESSFIVTGDFNIFPNLGGEETYKLLTNDELLMDAHFKSIFPHHGPTGSWSGFKEPGQPGVKPDYIFVNKTLKVITHGILADSFDGNYPSDHLPIIAEIEIN
jgi:endonuclease/exonuclease/phosphatase family metal-dependent hydrolase